MIHYPWTRHLQRYEYLLQRGWIANKTVADIGAGTCAGSISMSVVASKVYLVDTSNMVKHGKKMYVPSPVDAHPERMISEQKDLFDFHTKVDVVVAVEVFEHMVDPQRFIDHLASLCKNLYITTPLSMLTRVTRNAKHYREYCIEDFEAVVSTKFNILERKYQMSDLRMENKPEFSGDSIDMCHTVQILWCELR